MRCPAFRRDMQSLVAIPIGSRPSLFPGTQPSVNGHSDIVTAVRLLHLRHPARQVCVRRPRSHRRHRLRAGAAVGGQRLAGRVGLDVHAGCVAGGAGRGSVGLAVERDAPAVADLAVAAAGASVVGAAVGLARQLALAAAEERLERADGRAADGDVDLDLRPEIDEQRVEEGVGRERPAVDCVQAHDGGDAREGAHAEDEEERDLLSPRPQDRHERLARQDQDPDVGDDVEARGGCERVSREHSRKQVKAGEDGQ
jgi:hypothetical protein